MKHFSNHQTSLGETISDDEVQELESRVILPKTYSTALAMEVESERTPCVFKVPIEAEILNLMTSTEELVEKSGYSKYKSIQSFDSTHTTIAKMISSQPAHPKRPISIVEDMYIQNGTPVCEGIQPILKWNGLSGSDAGRHLSSNTLVLSEPGAASLGHQHGTMFWNFAVSGAKVYILYDSLYAAETNVLRKTLKQTKNLFVPRKLTLQEFLRLPRDKACIAVTLSDEQPMIVVPTYWYHEVHTVWAGRNSHCYGGLVGLALPNNPFGANLFKKLLELKNSKMGLALAASSSVVTDKFQGMKPGLDFVPEVDISETPESFGVKEVLVVHHGVSPDLMDLMEEKDSIWLEMRRKYSDLYPTMQAAMDNLKLDQHIEVMEWLDLDVSWLDETQVDVLKQMVDSQGAIFKIVADSIEKQSQNESMRTTKDANRHRGKKRRAPQVHESIYA
jgi:hypothetical protein